MAQRSAKDPPLLRPLCVSGRDDDMVALLERMGSGRMEKGVVAGEKETGGAGCALYVPGRGDRMAALLRRVGSGRMEKGVVAGEKETGEAGCQT